MAALENDKPNQCIKSRPLAAGPVASHPTPVAGARRFHFTSRSPLGSPMYSLRKLRKAGIIRQLQSFAGVFDHLNQQPKQ